ncbi:immunoglobulin-like domain-containing protein [Carnobacterium gallinarum]|uniref:immunoglobulin-like domain-containing protein n=1 Tax=Carnobacterium gallinarum TaxID=2749 RepID=UPI000690C72C|nr:immunoglobulin-like domain-containing protein [Carnobacterium gallinarum]
MNKLKLVGLGAILCCGLMLSQVNAEAAKNSEKNVKENILESMIVNQMKMKSAILNSLNVQGNLLETMQINREGAELTSFNYTGQTGLFPQGNFVNKKGYLTTDTTMIRIQGSDQLSYRLMNFASNQLIAIGEGTGSEISFNLLSLSTTSDYGIVSVDRNGVQKELIRFDVHPANDTPPIIHAEDKEIPFGSDFKALEGVTAEDIEDGDLTDSVQVVYDGVDTQLAGIYDVRYEVIDSEGNIGTKSIKVTVLEKNAAPVIQAEDRTIYVGDTFVALEGVTAEDAEDGNLTSKIEVVSNDVNTQKAGIYEVTYQVKDSADEIGTKTIKVTVLERNKVPVIKAEDRTIYVGDTFVALEGVTAEDAEDGNLTSKIEVVSNDVNTQKAGIYTVSYRVKDSAGEYGTKTIKVTVLARNTAPVIKAEDRMIRVGDTFDALEGVTAEDAEDGNLTSKIEVVSNNVDTQKMGIYEVTYEVKDSAGEVGTKTIKVTVLAKNTPPVIKAKDSTIYVGDTFDALEGVTAEDAEDGDLTSEIVVVLDQVDTSKVGEYQVLYSVTDTAGSIVRKSVTVNVIERATELPAPQLNPVFNTDTAVEGKATKNTTLYLTIAGDKYEESVNENGNFSVVLDQTYAAGSTIEAHIKDASGHTSASYIGTVQKHDIQKPVLDKLTDKDLSLSGSGRMNTTLMVTIGNDHYATGINENGLFKLVLDQTYPVGTAIEAYILDSTTGEKSEVTYAKVVASEDIFLNRVTSIDKGISGKTFANADIKVRVFNYRDRIYEGKSDENGNLTFVFTRAYPAGTSITVTVTNPITGNTFEKTIQIYPRKPTINTIVSGDKKVEGSADPLGQVVVTINNQVTEGIADSAGNYLVRVSEEIPQNASVLVYQVVDGIRSEATELIVTQ